MRKSSPAAELERLLGVAAVSWERVESGGYGRVSAHWRVQLEDGRSVFVKQALSEDAKTWLRKERRVYEGVVGSFMPTYFGAHDNGEVLLVIEDLSGAEWPPPWSPERIDAVLTALAELRATTPPAGLERLEDARESVVGWPAVRDDPSLCCRRVSVLASGSSRPCRCCCARPRTLSWTATSCSI